MSTRWLASVGAMIVLVGSCVMPAWAQRPLGVDVSRYTPLTQSEWNAIRASGRTFAFARASWGWGGIDSEFQTHMARGQAAGLYMGAYHFEYAGYSSGHTPIAEANTFLSVARPYIGAGYLRPVLDVEWVGDNLNGLTLTQWCRQWMDYVEQQTGVEPLIYCNLPWANQLDSTIKNTDLWWAAWPDNPNPQTDNPSTDGWATWRFWQYAGDVTIPGVTDKKVDLNVFNGTSATLLNFVVAGGGQISKSTTSLTRTVRSTLNVSGDDAFTIWNGGVNTMPFVVTSNVSWATVNPDRGSSTGADNATTITVSYAAESLDIGVHTGTITITAAGATNSPQTIALTLNVQPIPGDMDKDGDIDLTDAGLFAPCLSGPGLQQTNPNCLIGDADQDGDVDMSDFGIVQKCTTGPTISADPYCSPL